jgi:hypothetical protein
MKKIILSLSTLFFTIGSFAQLIVSADTNIMEIGKGLNAKPIINITNSGTNAVSLTWFTDVPNCILPAGFLVSGVCELPGDCYPFNTTVHTASIAAGATLGIEPAVSVDVTAATDAASYVVVNTDANGGKNLVFKIIAKNWPTSVNQMSAQKIDLSLYPTPASNTLNVVHNNKNVAKAIVINMLGRKVSEFVTPAKSNGFSIPVGNLADGMYIIDVRDAAGRSIATQRFSKN